MPVINPAINISIGSYGEKYISSFHKYFTANEPVFSQHSSFFECGFDSDHIYFNSIQSTAEISKIEIKDSDNREDLYKQLGEDDNIYFLKNCISNAYFGLINLENQLDLNVSFQIININFIISCFEENSTILLYRLIEQISELSKSGAINHISIKAFIIISKNQDVLKTNEQIIAYQSFEEIKTIHSKFNNVLHNIIFIDNLNTNAIFLRINYDSIGFILNEFITYLMTNHYKMIGNLLDADFLSLGLGTLFFDERFFSVFFKNMMLNKLVCDEQFQNNAEYENLRDKTFYPFLRGEYSLIELLSRVNLQLDISVKNHTLLELKFLLSNLLGKFEDVQMLSRAKEQERISLYDLAFKILNGFKEASENKVVDIVALKKRLDEEYDLKEKLKTSKQTPNGLSALTINSRLDVISKTNKEENQIIKRTLAKFKANQIKSEIDNFIKPNLCKSIDELKIKREKLVKGRRPFFKKWFKAGLNIDLISLDRDISQISSRLDNIDREFILVERDATLVFELIRKLEDMYALILKIIEGIKDYKIQMNKQYSSLKLLDYLFIKNVIDEQKLMDFFSRNEKEFESDFSSLLKKIQSINSESIQLFEKENRFFEYFNVILENKVKSIIQFNIVEYMNGNYNHLNLFKNENLNVMVGDLLNIAKPFFNSDNSFNSNYSHCLMLHCSEGISQGEITNLHNRLKSCFTSTIPQQIETFNPNKFSIIQIDIIHDFKHIVKYNDSKKVYDRFQANNFIIR